MFRPHVRCVLLGYDTMLPGTDPESHHIHLHRIKTLKYINEVRASRYMPCDATIIIITAIIIIIIIIVAY
jgi:hypothetical protein